MPRFSKNYPAQTDEVILAAGAILLELPSKNLMPENDLRPDPARIAHDLRTLEVRVDALYELLRDIFLK